MKCKIKNSTCIKKRKFVKLLNNKIFFCAIKNCFFSFLILSQKVLKFNCKIGFIYFSCVLMQFAYIFFR